MRDTEDGGRGGSVETGHALSLQGQVEPAG